MPKRFKLASLLSVVLFFCLQAHAEDATLVQRETTHRSSMLIGGSVVQLQTPSVGLSGYGGIIAYRYAVDSKWALRPHLAQAFGTTGGGKSLFTSLGGIAEYALTGTYLWGETVYETRGEPVAKLSRARGNIWIAGLGFEQLFLSGSESVYAAPGFTAVLGYDFTYSAHPFGVEVKFGQYSSGDKPFTGIMIHVLSSFDL